MKAKRLSFAFLYFSDSALFNGLQRIQTEKSGPVSIHAPGVSNRTVSPFSRPHPPGPRVQSDYLRGIALDSDFRKIMSDSDGAGGWPARLAGASPRPAAPSRAASDDHARICGGRPRRAGSGRGPISPQAPARACKGYTFGPCRPLTTGDAPNQAERPGWWAPNAAPSPLSGFASESPTAPAPAPPVSRWRSGSSDQHRPRDGPSTPLVVQQSADGHPHRGVVPPQRAARPRREGRVLGRQRPAAAGSTRPRAGRRRRALADPAAPGRRADPGGSAGAIVI
jgi:hypothetical protein